MSGLRFRLSARVRKLLLSLFAVVMVVYFAFAAFIWRTMHQPPEAFGRVMANMPRPVVFLFFPFGNSMDPGSRGGLRCGGSGPRFLTPKSGQKRFGSALRLEQATTHRARLRQYGDRVAFLVVYITEAHPSDVWQMQSNIKDKVVFASPKSEEERALVAGACVRKLGIQFPAVLDGFGNSTERQYTAWPDRIYLVDATGRVAYKSKPGPFGFKAEELKAALARVVQVH